MHEIDYRLGRRKGVDAFAARAFWRQVDTIVLHTDAERDDFIASFGVSPDRIKVVAHGASFVKRTRADRATARRTLGIDPDAFVFLAIGFIQPHKGFDRAVRAFEGLAEHGCELYVVGSVRVDDPGFASYLGELEGLVDGTPGTFLRTGFVSDELFDRWIVACRRGGAALPPDLELLRARAGDVVRQAGPGHGRGSAGRPGRRPAVGDPGRR